MRLFRTKCNHPLEIVRLGTRTYCLKCKECNRSDYVFQTYKEAQEALRLVGHPAGRNYGGCIIGLIFVLVVLLFVGSIVTPILWLMK